MGTACRKNRLINLLWCLAIMVLATAVSGTIATVVFDRVPHVEDEIAYFWQGRIFEAGRIAFPAPPSENFWMPYILMYHGLWFGKYPPGYPLALAAGLKLDAGWLVNPILGGIALASLYLVGAKLYNRRTGLIAAGLALLSPFYLILSGSFMSHIASLVGFTLFLLFFLQTYTSYPRRPNWRWWVFPLLAGMALGYCFLTRQLTAIGLVVPWVVLAAVDAGRGGRERVARWALVIAGFLPFFLFLAYFNYTLAGNPFKNLYELDWGGDRIGFGPGIGTLGEYTLAMGINNWKEAYKNLQEDLFGWKPAFFLVVLPFVLMRFDRWVFALLYTPICLMLVYLLYWTPGFMYGPRYYFEAIPCLFLLIAVGLDTLILRWQQLWCRLTPVTKMPARITGALLVLGILAVIAWQGTAVVLPQQMAEYKNWYGMSDQPLREFAKTGIDNALVFVDASKGWTAYGVFFIGNDPGLTNPVIFARDSGEAANRRVIELYPRRKVYLYRDGLLLPYTR